MAEGWTYSKAGVNIDKKSSSIESLVEELKYKRSGFGQMVQDAMQESSFVRWFYDHNVLWLLIEVFLGL